MNSRDTNQNCALVIIADGFDEVETIVILCTLRKAGLCAKSVGLTRGLINGSHGTLVMPDFTLANLSQSVNLSTITLLALPGGDQNLAKLEPDPRVHRLLLQVISQRGLVATNVQGLKVLKAAIGQQGNWASFENDHVMLWHPQERSVELFARDLVRRLERPVHV